MWRRMGFQLGDLEVNHVDFLWCTLLKTNSSHLKMVVSNRNLLFQGSIFRCYVSFREGTQTTMRSNTSRVEPQLFTLESRFASSSRNKCSMIRNGGPQRDRQKASLRSHKGHGIRRVFPLQVYILKN